MRRKHLPLLFTTVCLVLLLVFPIQKLITSLDKTNRLSYLETIVGAKIPDGAKNIYFQIGGSYSGYILLSFSTSKKEAVNFASIICNGVLHEGYNPFVSRNIGEPFSYTVLINMNGYSYYSYSSLTPNIDLGNRCWNEKQGIRQIAITKLNADLFEVKFEQTEPCNDARLPCSSIEMKYIEPIKDFPIIMIGMEKRSSHEYTLILDEFCIDTNSQFFNYLRPNDNWLHLIGAKIVTTVDGNTYDSALIEKDGSLKYLDPGKNDNVQPARKSFFYCINGNWKAGTHILTFTASTVSKTYSYSLKFDKVEQF